ncbi:MAG: crossover junction endodeoxyribonuclease RuvC, partial [Gammaproteobacteria bacterium]|nr:crossover junction endodeoxyribonuclease RuvC [Gammaproteobacteria bacterium]
MTRILGIDPGSRQTGYGIIDQEGSQVRHVASGHIPLQSGDFPERLRIIHDGITDLVEQYQPTELAIEKVFVHRNADSALKLGQARAAAICGTFGRRLGIAEYTP